MKVLGGSTIALVSFLLCPGARADLRIVDAAGLGDFTTIQAAVDASVDGDLILVRPGNYTGFVIDDKKLTLARESPIPPQVAGTIEVKNLDASRYVLIGGFSVQGASSPTPALCKPALQLSNDLGGVRIQNSVLFGGDCIGASDFINKKGASAVVLADAADVAFASSHCKGGNGGGISFLWLDSIGGDGGHGISSASSNVAVYDCELEGGRGGDAALWSGTGGDGLRVASGQSFASKTEFLGGQPGVAWGDDAYHFGSTGAGVSVQSGAAVLLGCTGAGPGPGIQTISGSGRTFTVVDVSDPAIGVRVAVQGIPGDQVYLAFGRKPAFHLSLALSGVRLLAIPALAPLPSLGTIPSSGVLYIDVPLAPLAVGDAYRVDLAQGFVIAANQRVFLGAPLTITRVP